MLHSSIRPFVLLIHQALCFTHPSGLLLHSSIMPFASLIHQAFCFTHPPFVSLSHRAFCFTCPCCKRHSTLRYHPPSPSPTPVFPASGTVHCPQSTELRADEMISITADPCRCLDTKQLASGSHQGQRLRQGWGEGGLPSHPTSRSMGWSSEPCPPSTSTREETHVLM